MFLLFELIYSFLQSSSVNTASHGPLSHVEINSYGNLSKSKTFYRTTVLKFKKLESERICPCILHWHPASKAFRLAYLRKTHARLLPEYIISNRSLIGRELATAGSVMTMGLSINRCSHSKKRKKHSLTRRENKID